MYRIAICDDEETYIDYLERLFKQRLSIDSEKIKLYKYTSGEDLVNSFSKEIPYNLLILDMKLSGIDGDETAQLFREKYPDVLLVFCSGSQLPSVKSFEANAYRFLLKDYDSDRMVKELEVIVSEMQKRADTPSILAQYRKNIEKVSIDHITYVDNTKHGSIIHTHNGSTSSNEKIGDIFQRLQEYDFAFIHTSYFVNLKYIKRVENHLVILTDETILPIARSKEKEFREKYISYLGSKY